jgi:L-alanine-DL-glutamate epimerase-like enolase superfamily enzyme
MTSPPRITRIRAYRQWQPFRDGDYGTAGGIASGFDSTIVAIDTDQGVTGWGEMAPLGSFYSPAFAAGARAGIQELAPLLIGADVIHPHRLMEPLHRYMQGQPYIKSALDMAAWDLTAKLADRPLHDLLGGADGHEIPLYRPIPGHAQADSAHRYVLDGYARLQVKVGADPIHDAARLRALRQSLPASIVIFADANGAWTTAQARVFLGETHDLDIAMEQPCETIEECASIRDHCPHPLILDESIDSLRSLLRAVNHGVADGLTLKLSRLGGITPTVLLRDVAVELGVPITIEDTGGGTIDTAAVLHTSLGIPRRLRLHTSDLHNWITADVASGIPPVTNGALSVPQGPGLGVDVLAAEVLGDPFLVRS